MSKRPTKPFTLAANPDQELKNIRDKDNAAPELPAPSSARSSRPNLAPPGMSGIKRNLPSPAPQKAEDKPQSPGDLTKTFMSLARLQKDKDHDIDR